LLAALEQNGWLMRIAAADRRAQSLHLTESGLAKLRHWHTLVVPHEDRLAARLGPRGRENLLQLLQTLVRG
jgi:DNA-binding MarR family transcriptional regulator